MSLHIENADANQADVYKVVIKLVNVGKAPIELIAQWDEEEEKDDYSEFLKNRVQLTSFPEIRVHSAQTIAGTKRTSPQPTLEIKPGDTTSFEWITAKRLLKPQGYYNTFPDQFPCDGLYGIRASFLASSKQGNRILLYSNECQLAVGKSTAMPKFATARIIQADAENKTVLLDLGSDKKIEPNDRFEYIYFPAAHWDILITEVKETVSTGSVKITGGSPGQRNVPAFPPVGSSVTLIPVGFGR